MRSLFKKAKNKLRSDGTTSGEFPKIAEKTSSPSNPKLSFPSKPTIKSPLSIKTTVAHTSISSESVPLLSSGFTYSKSTDLPHPPFNPRDSVTHVNATIVTHITNDHANMESSISEPPMKHIRRKRSNSTDLSPHRLNESSDKTPSVIDQLIMEQQSQPSPSTRRRSQSLTQKSQDKPVTDHPLVNPIIHATNPSLFSASTHLPILPHLPSPSKSSDEVHDRMKRKSDKKHKHLEKKKVEEAVEKKRKVEEAAEKKVKKEKSEKRESLFSLVKKSRKE